MGSMAMFAAQRRSSRRRSSVHPLGMTNGPPTRKRISVACKRCRKRKIKCSGDVGDGSGCVACRAKRAETPCTFLRIGTESVLGLEEHLPAILPSTQEAWDPAFALPQDRHTPFDATSLDRNLSIFQAHGYYHEPNTGCSGPSTSGSSDDVASSNLRSGLQASSVRDIQDSHISASGPTMSISTNPISVPESAHAVPNEHRYLPVPSNPFRDKEMQAYSTGFLDVTNTSGPLAPMTSSANPHLAIFSSMQGRTEALYTLPPISVERRSDTSLPRSGNCVDCNATTNMSTSDIITSFEPKSATDV